MVGFNFRTLHNRDRGKNEGSRADLDPSGPFFYCHLLNFSPSILEVTDTTFLMDNQDSVETIPGCYLLISELWKMTTSPF